MGYISDIGSIEYGVSLVGEDGERHSRPHRTGMSFEEAKKWIEEWESGGARIGSMVIIFRPIGVWRTLKKQPKE